MNELPEDIVNYIIKFLWKCNTCDDYLEMKGTYDKYNICVECQYKMIWKVTIK